MKTSEILGTAARMVATLEKLGIREVDDRLFQTVPLELNVFKAAFNGRNVARLNRLLWTTKDGFEFRALLPEPKVDVATMTMEDDQ